jgi:hypothetical protein
MRDLIDRIDFLLESLDRVSEKKESDNEQEEILSDEEILKLKEGGIL